jgi:molybdate transport system substrate-binding protein
LSVRARLTAGLLAFAVTVMAAGCGSAGAGGGGGDLVVSAASSLTEAFPAYARSLGGAVRFQFAGSDELAAQIGQGVEPDVFAAASPRFPEQLHAEGRVGAPVAFATNRLVLAVPRDGRVRSLADLATPGTTIAIGSPDVPIGSYTREVLGRLGAARANPIFANVRSAEPDVKGIVGKLAQGAVDAGLVYVTDVDATDGRLRAIELPAALQPQVAYAAAVVTGAPHPAAARRFVAGLLRGVGAAALRAAGFAPPPVRAGG